MMRILASLLLASLTMGIAQADMFYPNNNPFPNQTSPESFNNIYETTPAAIQQDKQTTQKVRKSKWWKVQNDETTNPANEGIQRVEDTGFVIFK